MSIIIILTIWLLVFSSVEPTITNTLILSGISFITTFLMFWFATASHFIEDSLKKWSEKNRQDLSLYHLKKRGENEKYRFFGIFKEHARRISRKGETIPPDIEQNLFSTDPEQFFRNAEYLGYTIQLKRKKLKDDTLQES